MRNTIIKVGTGVFAVIGFIASVFQIFGITLKNAEKDIEFKLLANNYIFDINNDLPDLKIYYQDKDLRSANEVVSFMKLRVYNRGEIPLRESDFDSDFPLSFNLTKGEIIENPSLLESSDSSYFSKKIKIIVDTVTKQKVKLSNFILEKNAYFTFKLLVKHKSNEHPQLNITGKIAGIDKMLLTDNIEKNQVFGDKYKLYMYMAVILFVLFVLLILKSVYDAYSESPKWKEIQEERNKREKYLNEFFQKEPHFDPLKMEMFKSIIGGYNFQFDIDTLIKLLKDEEYLNNYLKDIVIPKSIISAKFKALKYEDSSFLYSTSTLEKCILTLLDSGNIKLINNRYMFDDEFKSLFTQYLTFTKYKD